MEHGKWYTSRKSGSNGNCVEVKASDDRVSVRDTKNRNGGTLTFTEATWTAFIAEVKGGTFNL